MSLVVNMLTPSHLALVFLRKFDPREETRLEVHHGEEWVDRCWSPTNHESILLDWIWVLFLSFFILQSELHDPELSHELVQGHHFVESDAAELRPHDPVQHFIEVNKAIVNLDAYLDNDALHIQLPGSLHDSHLLGHALWQTSKEVIDVLHLHFHALIPSSVVAPCLFEVLEIFLETLPWIVFLNIVLLKLLDNDENEQVQHNVSHQKNEREEEKGCQLRSTCLAFNAATWSVHAVIHDSIPILACRNRKEKTKALVEVRKVLPITNHISFCYPEEQRVAQDGHDEENEHQQDKHIDQWGDGHLNSFQERLQALILAS